MGSRTIKICDCCQKELDSETHWIHLNGDSNFGDWKHLEFCDILCFMSYLDGNIRAYKDALEKDLEKAGEESTMGIEDGRLLDMVRMLSGGGKKLKPFVRAEIALYDPYTNKFESNPFEEGETKPDGIRKLELD